MENIFIKNNIIVPQGLNYKHYANVIAAKYERGLLDDGARLHSNRETHWKVMNEKINSKQFKQK